MGPILGGFFAPLLSIGLPADSRATAPRFRWTKAMAGTASGDLDARTEANLTCPQTSSPLGPVEGPDEPFWVRNQAVAARLVGVSLAQRGWPLAENGLNSGLTAAEFRPIRWGADAQFLLASCRNSSEI